jgi:metal-responsive CopG/Arc/MetJ family transcriptional regulator
MTDQRGPLVTFTDIQHEFHAIIKASLHSHVTHDRRLEAIRMAMELKSNLPSGYVPGC